MPELEALIDRQLALEALLQNMAEGFAMCEAIWAEDGSLCDYTILELNAALQRMLRVGPEAIGTKLSDSAGDRTQWLQLCEGVLKTGVPASFESHTRAADLWHEIRVTRVDDQKIAQLFFDITERKRAEARQASLFDELNHRVSNNLALVAGILQMKARDTDNDQVRDELLRAVSRVESITQVHRALYHGPQTDTVDFGPYLEALCEAVRAVLVQDDERVQVRVEPVALSLPVDTAIPLGMVVNELVTNAVKYAYPSPAAGLISVRASRDGDGLVLTVEDFGQGFPDKAPSRSGGGLGMKLVGLLVNQVGGQISRTGPPGTAYEVRVPLS